MRGWMAAIVAGFSVQPALAAEKPFHRAVAAVQERMALIDRMDGVIPGRAIVAVEVGRKPVVDVRGVSKVDSGSPADSDMPFYIASMTKAFVGLMAVQLDAMGVMPLDTKLAAVFPDMQVEGVDMGALTMERLLTHQLGFRAVPLNVRTAFTDLVPVEDYSAIVTASGTPIEEQFRYDNLGYLLYAAALEKSTGRSWRSWIDDVLFDPLGMQHSSARTSDFYQVSHLHERYEDGWRTYAPKSDAIMHAAGGLVVSAADMARWLQANVGERSAIPAARFAKAQSTQVTLDMEQGPMRCTGYAFGWRRCEAMGEVILEHGGSYTGMRGQMVILPERGVGFAAIFNSDSMTGGLSGQLMQTFITAMAGRQDELPTPQEFAQRYAERAATYRSNRSREEGEQRADAKWGGWQWKPSPTDLAEYAGIYRHPAMGTLQLAVDGNGLVGRLNGTAMDLEGAKHDLFAAVLATDGEVEELTFSRAEDGTVRSATFDGDRFERASD